MSPPARPVYTEEQVRKYLTYIGMKDRIPKESCDTEAGLKYLNKLILLQLAKVPFENLDLHYSPHHKVLIDTEHLFHKIVERNVGRGGYCMQNNSFFATILRSLGYKVMTCGSRVSSVNSRGLEHPDQEVTYSGWEHQVSLVHVDGRKYFADVGFGANCPSFAIPVEDGWKGRRPFTRDYDDMRLQRTHISENIFTNEEQKMWVYYHRFGPDKLWTPVYCFTELEFLPQDFRGMNFYVSNSLTSWFTYNVVVAKCTLDEDGREAGVLTLNGDIVKERRYGKSQILAELKSEPERVHALEMFFGIKLDNSEINGMNDYMSRIKD